MARAGVARRSCHTLFLRGLIADADDVDLNSDELSEWIEALWTAEGRILTVDETTTALLPRAVARAIGLSASLTVVAGPPLVQADHASVGMCG